MKITKIETFFVKPRWVFLKMQTDEGVTGWGEPIAEGWSRTTAAAVRETCDYLIGQDPRRIEHHWQALRPAMSPYPAARFILQAAPWR